MRILIFTILTILLFSCATKIIPLKGNYKQPPFIFNSTLSKDTVWERIIDVFAQQGLPIKIIERSSGLIISDRYQLTTTIENKEGNLLNNDAFIVVPKFYNANSKKYFPYFSNVTGEWNIRIKESGTGSTININIVNIKNVYYDYGTKRDVESKNVEYKSTGVFEKSMFDILNSDI